MKAKKLAFPIIVLAVAVLAMAVYGVVSNIAMKPTITEHEFPFSITYELNGETETVEGVYAVSYTGNGGYSKVTTRQYTGVLVSADEDADISFDLFVTEDSSLSLFTHLYPDYLMGDPEYDYFDDSEYEPILSYENWVSGEVAEGLDISEYGAKIISWEYPEPIENSFEFSHIAHMSGEVVFPFALIALLALLVVIIFVRRDKTLPKSATNIISIVLNFAVALVFVPFVSIYGIFIDINGSDATLSHQMGYLVPAVTLLGLAASVALRRRGFVKTGLFIQFVGPVFFALHLLLSLLTM